MQIERALRHRNGKSEVGKSTDLLKMLSSVRFLASQDSPMQDDGSGKDSNFIQVHILRDEDNEGLKNWRNEKKQ